jgi:hypothetical protein
MAKRWYLSLTINYPKGEAQTGTYHDTSDDLIMALGLILKEEDKAASFVATIVPGQRE